MNGYGYLEKQRERPRPFSRFLVFGMAVIIGMGTLGARLFYLQIVSGGDLAALAEGNRTALEPIPSSRGLIYDRSGAVLVTNVPTFAVKIRPADLPEARRDEVVARLSALTGVAAVDINTAIDGNPGSRFDAVRVAQDVPKETASLIAEASFELPGVEVAVEARRQYADGPLFSQILGYTGPVSAEQIEGLKSDGYLPDDLIGKTGLEANYESELRGSYGMSRVERDAAGRDLQVLETVRDPEQGDSLRLTVDTREQKLAEQALRWGMKAAGLKRGVVIVMNPQTGEILAMV
ncbi:MAG: penicillin-binding protein 2, partial [Chloroflexota bacterium]